MKHAIIAGTGIYDIPSVALTEKVAQTTYGETFLLLGKPPNDDLVFLPRHGVNHSVPPHKITYRANIKALADMGVKRVIANYAVGGIAPYIEPLSLTTLGDILDFTSGRPFTFFDGPPEAVKHVEMSQPYCPVMGQKIVDLAPEHGLSMYPNAVYVATNGPRFETPAEIRMYKQLGADVVGMTGMPEVALAREAGMCLAGIALSINWAAGLTRNIEIAYEGLPEIRGKLLQLCIQVLRQTSDEGCIPAQLL